MERGPFVPIVPRKTPYFLARDDLGERVFRYRVGGYRARYKLKDSQVLVAKIDKRPGSTGADKLTLSQTRASGPPCSSSSARCFPAILGTDGSVMTFSFCGKCFERSDGSSWPRGRTRIAPNRCRSQFLWLSIGSNDPDVGRARK